MLDSKKFEHYFSAILENIQEGFVVQNQEGRIIFFNDQASRILGLSAEQLLGRESVDPRWRSIREDGSDFPGQEHPAMVTLKTGKPMREVLMGVITPKEERVWIIVNSNILDRDQNSKPTLVFTTFSDVTVQVAESEFQKSARMQIEEAQNKSRLDQELMMSALKFGIWKWDIKKNELSWDQSLYDLFEVRSSDFSGAYDAWEKTLTPESKVVAVKELELALKGEKEFNTTFEIKTSRGVKPIGGRGVVTRGPAGEPISMAGINWDRTKEESLEKALSFERSRNIHASKLASLGEMAAGIAHEINNPLAIVSASLGMIPRLLNNPEKLQTKLDYAEKSIERISKIVNGLRKFSRMTPVKNVQTVDLSTLVEECLVLMAGKTKKFEVQIKCDVPKNTLVKVDEVEIEQVLVNLISNAVDALKDSTKRNIVIRTQRENLFQAVYVEDSGPGIPDAVRERIFEPFFTTKNLGEGTGLGLSIAKGIMEEHGGALTLEPSNVGAVFKITLPV
jgi:PAS domain S-box-containing protein